MTFKPGQSGNPSGRPKIVMADGKSVRDFAREHTEAAVKTLVDVMTDDAAPPPARVSAASAILDRGWGKPVQEIEAGENITAMLADIIAQRRAQVAGIGE